MSIAIAILIFVVALIFTLKPLFSKDEIEPSLERTALLSAEELFLKREALDTALQELEYDLTTGKISEQDYTEIKEQYSKEAAALAEEKYSATPKI